MRIGLANIVYNMRRFLLLERINVDRVAIQSMRPFALLNTKSEKSGPGNQQSTR
jgi:hypothetical protein